jgi:thymidylate kinase
MQTVIILEGHDKSGKSTIAKALSAELNIPIFKAKREKYWWDPMVNILYFVEGIMQFIEQSGTSVILDRWVPSDFVYSTLFKRDISFTKIWDIDSRLADLDALLVVCYKTKEAFVEDEEDADFITMADYDKMTDLYREYCTLTNMNKVLFIDTSDKNITEQIKKIKNAL